jgi:hypothetical protein
MALPKFTAELSLSKSTRVYRGRMAYGNHAATSGAAPANVMPSQFDDFGDVGDSDESALFDEADGDYGDVDENGDADFADLENGEDSEFADEDADLDEVG